MSDTEEMVRIMEHAAEQLRAEIHLICNRQFNELERTHMDAALTAMSFARAVLLTVAASIAPEGRKRVLALSERLREEYAVWAEKDDGVAMSDGELASVARFLRSTLDPDGAS